MSIAVYIVDDHYMVIEGIRSLLENEKSINWVGHATTAEACLSFLKHQKPDVVLMDINLPDKTGIELCREVRSLYPSVFVIGLSTFNQQSFIHKMIDNGASGYLLKNATQQELMEGISAVAKGKIYLSHEAAQVFKKQETEDVPVLTRREVEVLGLIAEGLTNNEIAEKLFVSPATVDTHRKNLLAKFAAKNTANLVRMASQLKFI